MRRRAPISALARVPPGLPLAVALAVAVVHAPAPAAAAALTFTPCTENPGFQCTTVTVPLDRGGQVPGTVALKVERRTAGPVPSPSAVLALSGGPGQAATPSAEYIAKSMTAALASRDLVVFDQRGTGQSDPLSCPALGSAEAFEKAGTIGELFAQCALQIGPARGFFTTQDSVQDIDAIRQALGYEKLALRGVSYGTKVALEYAERYPQHVESLLLDSVVPTTGPEPFGLPTFQAIGSALREICAAGACRRITANPLADVARLAAQLRAHPLRGSVYDGSGRRRSASLYEVDLLGILQAGDLNPTLRALLPAAVQSALRRDPGPLLRLNLLSQGLVPNLPGPAGPAEEAQNDALNPTTLCEETQFPWRRTDPAAARQAEATAALNALPSADFYPFDRTTALASSTMPSCLDWPNASPAPPPPGPLPNVPTLILSGAQDLRTPTANARGVAARIPDAQLVVVPFTGHSVIGTDFSGCAQAAVNAFYSGAPVQPCRPTPDTFSPTPVAPTTLSAIRPPSGVGGRPGQTLTAALDTIVDLSRQVIGATLQANRELPSGSGFGGLRSGYARIASSSIRLSRYSFVPGVQLSGTFPIRAGKLQPATIRVGGPAAAAGTMLIGAGQRVSGTLGGRHFSVSVASAHLSSAATLDAHAQCPGWGEFPVSASTRLQSCRLAPVGSRGA